MIIENIGGIGNTYGGLNLKSEDGKFFWSISGCFGDDWKEIPESLFNSLLEFENSRGK